MDLELDQFRDVDLVIDRANDSFVQKQFVSQGDYKGRTLTVQVTNNGNVGEVPGLMLNLNWHNEASGLTDLTAFSILDKANSIYRIEYPQNMMTPGKVIASIQVIQDGKVTNLKQFELTVQNLAGQPVGIVEKAEFSALVAVLADANRFRTDIDDLDQSKASRVELETVETDLSMKIEQNALNTTNQLGNKVDKGGASQVTWGMIAQDAREQISGDKVAVVGPDSVNTPNLVDGAVTSVKLSGEYNYKKYINSGMLSTVLNNGLYLFSAQLIGDSPLTNGNGQLEVRKTGDYVVQIVTNLSNPKEEYYRIIRPSINNVSSWVSSLIGEASISRSKLAKDYNFVNTISTGSYNDLLSSGIYLMVGEINDGPIGINGSSILKVEVAGQWIHQTFATLQMPSQRAYRFYNGTNWSAWDSIKVSNLTGSIVVNLGDSIFGNTQNATSVSSYIAKKTGAVVYNCGFGGTRMGSGQEIDRWQAFSMFRLADEIVKEATDDTKWNIQDNAISNTSWSDKPAYFENSLERLKGIDFSKVDIITIAYGTNDYTGGNAIDDVTNSYNTDTFAGALRHSLKKIMTKYPNVKILLCTPTYRLWFNSDGTVESDSDSRDYAGTGSLIGYVEKTKDIAKEYKVLCIDNYYELGINRFNALNFFTVQDGTHHNSVGRKVLGEKIGANLLSFFS